MWHPTEAEYTLAGVIGSLYIGWRNSKKITEVHVMMNSRLTELLKASTDAARAESHAAGMADQRNIQQSLEEKL